MSTQKFLKRYLFLLQKGNSMADTIEDNFTSLDMLFSAIEKDKEKFYPNVKNPLKTLSFNEKLKYVENKFFL